jgi:O-antigen/teichoic acid export membrane protein
MKIKFFQGSELFSNILTLVFGTFLAQMIPILLQSVLRRIYSPEDFGAIAIFISITGIFVVVSTLRYEMAINIPKKKSEAINIFFLTIIISLTVNIILLLLVIFFKNSIASFINLSSEYSYILYFSPVSIFLFSTYQAINYYLAREKAFRAISVNKVSRRVFEGAAQASFGILRNPHGLLFGDIIGHFVQNIAGWFQILRRGFSFRLFSFKKQLYLAKVYKEFPIINLLPTFFNSICLNMVVILLSMFYNEETVGYFDLTRLVLGVPAAMLTLSISQVLLQSISQKRHMHESIKSDIKRLIIFLSILGLVLCIVIFAIAPWAFQIYAGELYRISGQYAQIIVPATAIKVVVAPISIIFVALKKIKILSIWQVSNFLLLCCLYFFRNLEIEVFLKIYAAIDIFSYLALLLLIFNLVKNYENSLKLKHSRR